MTGKPWLKVYGRRASAETEIFEGSLGDFFRVSESLHLLSSYKLFSSFLRILIF